MLNYLIAIASHDDLLIYCIGRHFKASWTKDMLQWISKSFESIISDE